MDETALKFSVCNMKCYKNRQIHTEFDCGCYRLCRVLIIVQIIQVLLTAYMLVQSSPWKARLFHTGATCTKWQAEKRFMYLPEPAEMNAELSTLSPHFLFVFVAGVILGICYVLTHQTLSSPDSEHYLNSNYELHSY